jgi:SAM-dependent methyltransferase
VARFAPLIPLGGTVLDVACGRGRHARSFLSQGHPVVGVDRDGSGVADLVADPRFEFVGADLEDGSPFPLAGRTFAAVVVTNYLFRPLFVPLTDAVARGGVLLYETYAKGQERFGEPSNPAFHLEPGELLEAVRGKLRVIAYEDVITDEPHRSAIQRICAVRES